MLVGANWYRFGATEQIHHDLVVTVCFVWVVQGSGTIRTGGRDFHMGTHSVLRLPWRHTVAYLPDPRSPFVVGTIHLVPWHDFNIPVETRPPFRPGDPLLDAPYRRTTGPPQRAEMLSSRSGGPRNIITLGTYAIDQFHAAPVTESTCRALGTLIAAESSRWSGADEPITAMPIALQVMTDFILANLESRLSVAQVAAAGGCSTVTAERIFAKHTGLPVLAWTRDQRMQRAATLLRTSSLRSSEVARLVGYADPLYFSRVFRAAYSVPPSVYATGQLRP